MRRAWCALKSALDVATAGGLSRGTADVLLASTMRCVADYQMACHAWREAAETMQLVSCIVEGGHGSPYSVACAHVDQAAVQLRAGLRAEAEERLRKAMPALRRRKGGNKRAWDAANMLSSLVRPHKRLRGRTHPEDIESG